MQAQLNFMRELKTSNNDDDTNTNTDTAYVASDNHGDCNEDHNGDYEKAFDASNHSAYGNRTNELCSKDDINETNVDGSENGDNHFDKEMMDTYSEDKEDGIIPNDQSDKNTTLSLFFD